MQECDFNKVALHQLLLNMDPNPRPGPWTRAQKVLDSEKPGSWKTSETAGSKKIDWKTK